MTLTDAGPLVALIDANEPEHERCAAALSVLAPPLLTSWAAFAEAMYLLGRRTGWPGQAALWQMVHSDALALTDVGPRATDRTAELMHTSRDHPMDLADATLVALAEERRLTTVFTLDAHFRAYRLRDGRHLDVVPE